MQRLIILFSLFVLESCGNDEKGPPNQGYCRSIKESKDKGVFEFKVAALKSTLQLDEYHTVEIKNAWVENLWWSQVHLFGATTIEKGNNWHQLILTYSVSDNNRKPAPNVYYFVGSRPKDDTLVHYNCNRIDTIRVPLYRETSPILPSRKKRKAFDSLTFVRAAE